MASLPPDEPLSNPLQPLPASPGATSADPALPDDAWLAWCQTLDTSFDTSFGGLDMDPEPMPPPKAEPARVEPVRPATARDGLPEDELADLVAQALQRLVGGDLDDRPRALAVVREALAARRERPPVVLRVAPHQAAPVRVWLRALQASDPGIGRLELLADRQLPDDVCRIESEAGSVVTTLDHQLLAVRQVLQDLQDAQAASQRFDPPQG